MILRLLPLVLLVVPPAFAQSTTSTTSAHEARFGVQSVTPAPNALDAPRTAAVQITFTQPVDPSTLVSPHFEVFGHFSGPAQGALGVSPDGRIVTFEPARAFSAGETVNVSLSKDVASTRGVKLGRAYAWSFWTDSRASTVSFSLAGTLVPGSTPYGATGCDLNDDGHLDLAIPNENSSNVSVFLNLGAGVFGPVTNYNVGFHCSPSEAADLDGDGDVDLAVANILADDVSVLIGNGDGTFKPQVRYPTGRQPRGLAVLDADSDGDVDLVTANRQTSIMSLLLNNGDGTFAPQVQFQANVNQETGVVACEMNGDGVTDLVVVGYASNQVAVLLGDGAGNFPVHQVRSLGASPWMVTWGDLDGDGDNDVAAVLSGEEKVGVLFNDGDGNLGAPITYAVGNFPISIDVGDLEGDGDLDLAASNFGSANFTFYRNNGAGTFGGKFTLSAFSAGSCTVLHDVDGDGDVDVTAIDEIADFVFLYRQDG